VNIILGVIDLVLEFSAFCMSGPNRRTRLFSTTSSKFYGEILGVNRVSLDIPAGITSLVGPNGAGKDDIDEFDGGIAAARPAEVSGCLAFRQTSRTDCFVNSATVPNSIPFPRGLTGREFIRSFLLVSGFTAKQADELTQKALERVDSLLPAADRKLVVRTARACGRRARLAQAIAHQPSVLILDEPLNGLDPMVRAETIALFQTARRRRFCT